MTFPFTQSWLPEPEPAFCPGIAKITIGKGKLYLLAELTQTQVATTATAHQQRLWEQGDVVEFFIQRVGDEDYYEYQIAPNGMILSLHYPDRAAIAEVRNGVSKMEEYLSDLPIEGSATVTPIGWNAILTIPVTTSIGDHFLVNCGRYDYSSGIAPVISSTSTLIQRDFHRLEDWREIILMEE